MSIDWTPVVSALVSALVPIAATIITILAGWVALKLSTLLGVQTDEKLRAAITEALGLYVSAAMARHGANSTLVATQAANDVLANLPGSVKKLGATKAQLERKAEAIIETVASGW